VFPRFAYSVKRIEIIFRKKKGSVNEFATVLQASFFSLERLMAEYRTVVVSVAFGMAFGCVWVGLDLEHVSFFRHEDVSCVRHELSSIHQVSVKVKSASLETITQGSRLKDQISTK